MLLLMHHVEGLYKVIMIMKFCTYNDCFLTNDLNWL